MYRPRPKTTKTAYKVFRLIDGKLYPPMVANPNGEATPMGVWLRAQAAEIVGLTKTGRPQVKATTGGTLAFRPGWHLGELPYASQFARLNRETGIKELFPDDFVWALCEYVTDKNYQEEAMSYGRTKNGGFNYALAGLPRVPEMGYYKYKTNPGVDTVPWIITGAIRVKRILTDKETDDILKDNAIKPMRRVGGVRITEKDVKNLIKKGN